MRTTAFNAYRQDIIKATEDGFLTQEEEIELGRRVANGDIEAKNIMISKNLRLVFSVAKKYVDRNNFMEDLVAEGNIGLIRAVEKFNPELGYRFSTYAIYWIECKIIEHKLSANYAGCKGNASLYFKAKKIANSYFIKHGIKIEDDVLADKLDITVDRLNSILEVGDISVESMNYEYRDSEVVNLEEKIPSENLDVNEKIFNDERMGIVKKIVYDSRLTDRERKIVLNYIGFDGCYGRNFNEIAKELRVSHTRVAQIYDKALKKMRVYVNKNGIRKELLSF